MLQFIPTAAGGASVAGTTWVWILTLKGMNGLLHALPTTDTKEFFHGRQRLPAHLGEDLDGRLFDEGIFGIGAWGIVKSPTSPALGECEWFRTNDEDC
jgi:hypothetical protein